MLIFIYRYINFFIFFILYKIKISFIEKEFFFKRMRLKIKGNNFYDVVIECVIFRRYF